MQSLKAEKQERTENALAYLRKILKPGDSVYGIVTHVSRSGMLRHIQLFATTGGGIENITWHAAYAQGDKPFDAGSQWVIKAGGCGMDMVFNEVYNLSRALFGKTFHCIGKGNGSYQSGCPSNDHSNDRYAEDYDEVKAYSAERNHSDSGYALRKKNL